jgi:hypothetical protein
MSAESPPDRIYIPGDRRLIDIFRTFRNWVEQHAAANGETLDPAWYQDGPEDRPELYPELGLQPRGEGEP